MTNGLPSPPTQAKQAPAAVQHLVIAYAASVSPKLQKAAESLHLPNLQTLLNKMPFHKGFKDGPDTPNLGLMPHERAGAVQGLAVCLTPCHWQIGMGHVVMLNPLQVQLSQAESHDLLQAMQPYFAQDGIEVVYESALVWRAAGSLFQNLELASLDRVIGMDVTDWMPQAPQDAPLRRLQSVMQMLIYNHPVNNERSAQGRWTVNSFWVHRTAAQSSASGPASEQCALDLREAALNEDPQAWCAAWQQLDAGLCGELLQSLANNLEVSLVLCSENNTRHYQAAPDGWRTWWHALRPRPSVARELKALID